MNWISVALVLVACGGSKSLGDLEPMSGGEAGEGSDTADSEDTAESESESETQDASGSSTGGPGDASTAGNDESASTGEYVCDNPQTDEILETLTFGNGPNSGRGVQPGTSPEIVLGFPGAEGSAEGIANLCVEWSVDPPGAATIEYEISYGALQVADDAAPDTVITVTADVENGGAIVELQTTVYTAATHPQVGYWNEVGWIACSDGLEIPTDGEQRNLQLNADNTFSSIPQVAPIAWGSYTFDIGSGDLVLSQEGGSQAVEFDGDGTITFEGDRLSVEGIWISDTPKPPAVCGQIFD